MPYMCCLSVGLFLAACGSFLHIFGTAFPQWESGQGVDVGLFEVCFDANGTCAELQDLSAEDRTAQALALTGVVCSLLGVLAATTLVLLALLGKAPRRMFMKLSSLLCLLAFLLAGGCAVFWCLEIHDDHHRNLDASFYMSSVGAGLLCAGGLLTLTSGNFLQGQGRKFTYLALVNDMDRCQIGRVPFDLETG